MTTRETTELKDAIRAAHRCDALYVATTLVPDVPGVPGAHLQRVAIFELVGHPSATRCYAWFYRDRADTRAATMLDDGLSRMRPAAIAAWNAGRAQLV